MVSVRSFRLSLILKTKVLQIKDFVWAMPATEHRKTYNQFRFKQVTVAEVFKYLKNLLRKKATGPDNLPPGILKDVAVIIAKPLSYHQHFHEKWYRTISFQTR